MNALEAWFVQLVTAHPRVFLVLAANQVFGCVVGAIIGARWGYRGEARYFIRTLVRLARGRYL